jgi:hypothetical protein
MDGNIFNSRGNHVGMVLGPSIFDLRGCPQFQKAFGQVD